MDDIEVFINTVVIPSLPAGSDRLDIYREAQCKDPIIMWTDYRVCDTVQRQNSSAQRAPEGNHEQDS